MVLRPPCVLPLPCLHPRRLQSFRTAVLTAMGQVIALAMAGQARAVQQQLGTRQWTIQQSAHRQRSQRLSICATVTTRSQRRHRSPQECGCPTVCSSMALCRAAGNSSSNSTAEGGCKGISSNEMVQQAAEARAGSWALHLHEHRPMELSPAQLRTQARQQAVASAAILSSVQPATFQKPVGSNACANSVSSACWNANTVHDNTACTSTSTTGVQHCLQVRMQQI
jgi:hypothetical protein